MIVSHGTDGSSTFSPDQVATALTSFRPLGLSEMEARAAVLAHASDPVVRLLERSSSCRLCAALSAYPLAVLMMSLFLPAPALDGPLEWYYGALCAVRPGHPHGFIQHPSHPPGRLPLCAAASAGWLRLVDGRPKIGLVACSAAKLELPAPAAHLYQGALFRKTRAFVERWCHAWAVLSARHWVVEPNRVLEPYEQRMPGDAKGRWSWDQMVSWEVYSRWEGADLLLLGGQDYARWLHTGNWSKALTVARPLEGLGIGQQMAWLDRAIAEGPRAWR